MQVSPAISVVGSPLSGALEIIVWMSCGTCFSDFVGLFFINLQQKSSCILVFCETDSNECLFEQLELLFLSLQLGRKVIRGCEKALD